MHLFETQTPKFSVGLIPRLSLQLGVVSKCYSFPVLSNRKKYYFFRLSNRSTRAVYKIEKYVSNIYARYLE